MATYLYRLGKFAYRRKGIVLSFWLAALVLAGVAAVTLSGPTKDTFSIPGTPAQEAQELMAERFPGGAADPFSSLSARYLVSAPEGQTLDEPQNQAAMEDMLNAIRGVEQVEDFAKAEPGPDAPGALVNPVAAHDGLVEQLLSQGTPEEQANADAAAVSPLSADRTVGYLDVPVAGDFSDVNEELREALQEPAEAARDAGLNVLVSGSAVEIMEPPGGASELVGMAVAAVVLVITFGSLVAAGMPLFSAIVGVGIGVALITAATGFLELSSMVSTLAIMIGLAVAIDYSLFILSRYRAELSSGIPRDEAAGRAVGTAGSAVVFAGLTVIIALLALRVVNIPFLTDMGRAAALTVSLAVLIAISMLPAVLGLTKSWVFRGRLPFLREVDPEHPTKMTNGRRWANVVTRIPVVTLLGGVALLGVLAIPAANLQLALPTPATEPPGTVARDSYEITAESFGEGRNGQLLVVADAQNVDEDARMDAFGTVVETMYGFGDVENAQIVGVNEAGDTAQILVTPLSGPISEDTMALVQDIRDAEAALAEETGIQFGVTGQTAMELDVSDRLADALIPYLLVVVGLAFILLMLVFRSILVPLTATLGFLLSVAATFGATVAIFQLDWLGIVSNPQPLVSFLPIFLIGVVFGLAMDYQVFLVSRMREAYVHGESAKDAIISGFSHGARVVTAAAVIMMSVFAAFIAEDMAFIKVMGFALAAAILFDAFIVRMVIIPSVMSLLGDKAWWLPRWLDRILPNVDVEGEKLTRQLETPKSDTELAKV
ncbi:MMPL family transporter [Hoyosella subflava]|uniref:RND superfamily resistance-nodulation-cell division:proton (H+) antiporter n=1 Tax=Hoyosella subflava (strain DSM 45089 / JCM 17490 / NBRC 109087 / DQS3-9A1) TaxID=443218 RepID=F6EF85_HOYSD|nr:MMPL family transporter [Hoyosella subflava]AEF38664.1 RND superfamily resistance-nodulation-cell division:proton (H+) antiporter [Hoyosella subflava DQS3-9A1]